VPPSPLPVIRDGLNKDPSRRPTARDLLLRLAAPPSTSAEQHQLHAAKDCGEHDREPDYGAAEDRE
jgi:hypothetical protein